MLKIKPAFLASISLLALANLSWAGPSEVNHEIGRLHGGLPYKQMSGGSTTTDSDECSLVKYGPVNDLKDYSLLVATCNGRVQAWLSKYEKQEPENPAENFVIVDFLSAGTLTKGQFSSSPFCSVNKSSKHFEWIAIYRGEGRKKYTLKNGGIVQGWVLNHKTKRFELAPPEIMKNIECIPEEYD